MISLVVIENTKRWSLELEGVEVVSARDYLTDPSYASRRGTTVYNMCRRYGYQSAGYYVSLLAEARGHRPLPSVATLRALEGDGTAGSVLPELNELVEESLAPLKSDRFELSVYFGRNLAKRYDRLSRALFNDYPAPFLRASFERAGRWRLTRIRAIATSEIPETHRDFVIDQAARFFARPRRARPLKASRWDLGILWSADDPQAPSNERAIRRFRHAFHDEGIGTDILGPGDLGRVGEYDGLLIRETTAVDHHTYRFARRAASQGLVVVDDPESIIRCTNKVYQAELFQRLGIPCPRTLVVHGGNVGQVAATVGLPCVLKKPDGSFSRGVMKAETEEELRAHMDALFEESELAVAQEWTPSAFDWRIGVLDGEALWACRYHMARGHWQIARESSGGVRYGRVEAVDWLEVPRECTDLALRAARPVGDGLYGVDVKEVDGRFLVMEVNDNPNIDAGCEDAVVGAELYAVVARWFRSRLDARGRPADRP